MLGAGRAMNQFDTDKVLKYLAEDPVIRVRHPDDFLAASGCVSCVPADCHALQF